MSRLARERKTVGVMIAMYCRDRHHGKELCSDCFRLRRYAFERLSNCKFGEKKPTCSKCSIHCYEPESKAKIKAVMRYAGPRMAWRHPIMAFRYLLDRRKQPQ